MTWSPPTMGNISLPCFVRAKFNRIRNFCPGLPLWSTAWESTCQRKGTRAHPWSEKIPRASRQLSPCAKGLGPTRQPLGRGAHVLNQRKPALHSEDPQQPNTSQHVPQSSHSVVSHSLRPHESQHARPPCPSPTPGVHSNSHPLSQ